MFETRMTAATSATVNSPPVTNACGSPTPSPSSRVTCVTWITSATLVLIGPIEPIEDAYETLGGRRSQTPRESSFRPLVGRGDALSRRTSECRYETDRRYQSA